MDLITAFNDCINAHDLEALSALMSEDHLFIDSAGAAVSGKQACLAAWAAFFAAFPDYRNVFETISAHGDEIVVSGRSECSDARRARSLERQGRSRTGRRLARVHGYPRQSRAPRIS